MRTTRVWKRQQAGWDQAMAWVSRIRGVGDVGRPSDGVRWAAGRSLPPCSGRWPGCAGASIDEASARPVQFNPGGEQVWHLGVPVRVLRGEALSAVDVLMPLGVAAVCVVWIARHLAHAAVR
jgi:hypothetical protein